MISWLARLSAVLFGFWLLAMPTRAYGSPPGPGRYRILRVGTSLGEEVLVVQLGLHVRINQLVALGSRAGSGPITQEDVFRMNPGLVIFTCGATPESARIMNHRPELHERCPPNARRGISFMDGVLYRVPRRHAPTAEDRLVAATARADASEQGLVRERREQQQARASNAAAVQRLERRIAQLEPLTASVARLRRQMADADRRHAAALASARREARGWLFFGLTAMLVVAIAYFRRVADHHAQAVRKIYEQHAQSLTEHRTANANQLKKQRLAFDNQLHVSRQAAVDAANAWATERATLLAKAENARLVVVGELAEASTLSANLTELLKEKEREITNAELERQAAHEAREQVQAQFELAMDRIANLRLAEAERDELLATSASQRRTAQRLERELDDRQGEIDRLNAETWNVSLTVVAYERYLKELVTNLHEVETVLGDALRFQNPDRTFEDTQVFSRLHQFLLGMQGRDDRLRILREEARHVAASPSIDLTMAAENEVRSYDHREAEIGKDARRTLPTIMGEIVHRMSQFLSSCPDPAKVTFDMPIRLTQIVARFLNLKVRCFVCASHGRNVPIPAKDLIAHFKESDGHPADILNKMFRPTLIPTTG